MLADESGEGTKLGGPMVNGEPLAMGTTLFELYLVLQRFLALVIYLSINLITIIF